MQIQLKQAEIVCALKQYIAKQGIDLAGKTIDIAFTSGRKDNGLSADISIEDTGTTTVVDVTEASKLTVVEPIPVVSLVPSSPLPEIEAPATQLVTEVPAKSLFG